MKTAEKANGTAKTNGAAVKEVKTNGAAVDKKAGQVNGTTAKEEQANTATAENGAAGKSKAEIRAEIEKAKPAPNLEGTIEIVETLHRLKKNRDKLSQTIESLESFVFHQRSELEVGKQTEFYNCHLTIEDDQRREFETKNPVLIGAVVNFLKETCEQKREEIEASIVLPQ